ncbi:EbsA family protein [Enterococcus timonensis]|uniref:EbsA family protein n=1 Tax=Enterococcus timonensis TaxID=1852364 RepID=UPI0022874739|nr:EbsA family protein [Enterococcus timonensis]
MIIPCVRRGYVINSYRFQPELATSLIYWSMTFVIFFTGVIVTLENTYIYWLSLFIAAVFLFFVWLGLQRVIQVDQEKIFVKSLLKVNRKTFFLKEIKEVQVAKNGLLIISTAEKSFHCLLGRKNSARFLKQQQENSVLKEKLKAVEKINITLS